MIEAWKRTKFVAKLVGKVESIKSIETRTSEHEIVPTKTLEENGEVKIFNETDAKISQKWIFEWWKPEILCIVIRMKEAVLDHLKKHFCSSLRTPSYRALPLWPSHSLLYAILVSQIHALLPSMSFLLHYIIT